MSWEVLGMAVITATICLGIPYGVQLVCSALERR